MLANLYYARGSPGARGINNLFSGVCLRSPTSEQAELQSGRIVGGSDRSSDPVRRRSVWKLAFFATEARAMWQVATVSPRETPKEESSKRRRQRGFFGRLSAAAANANSSSLSTLLFTSFLTFLEGLATQSILRLPFSQGTRFTIRQDSIN